MQFHMKKYSIFMKIENPVILIEGDQQQRLQL